MSTTATCCFGRFELKTGVKIISVFLAVNSIINIIIGTLNVV
jgi:hypothetical protein